MASIFFRRLADKYGSQKLKGRKYQEMITEILAHNNEKAGRAIGRLTNKNYMDSVKKLTKEKEKAVKLPNISEVLPKRSVFLIKGADTGSIISVDLRDRLQKTLRSKLKEWDSTGEKRMEIQRGTTTGKINNKLVVEFEKAIKETFVNYTKRDPSIGVPKNVHNIAVTEIRSTVGTMKAEYKNKLKEKNPNLKMTKTWMHNRSLSKVPRKTHMVLHGYTIPDDERFYVERENGSGYDYMDRPHDPTAPPGQNITCNCDIIYRAIVT